MIPLTWVIRIIKIMGTKWNGGCQGLEGCNNGGVASWLESFSVAKKVLEIEGGDGCTTGMYCIPLTSTLKNALNGRYVMCIYHNKIKK